MIFQTLLSNREIYNITVDGINMVLLSNLCSISSVTPCLIYVFKGLQHSVHPCNLLRIKTRHTSACVYEKFRQSSAPADMIL